MRAAFISILVELAQRDNRILLLTGDLGYSVIEPFTDKFPDRFLNVGVAEQNMVGIATGLAKDGYIPFVYSIAPFVALRPYEFIRNGPVLHKLQVRLVGVGNGFDYGPAGFTHHGLEDVGVMRLQPGMRVIVPVSVDQTRNAILKTWDLPGPAYYRIGKAPAAPLPSSCSGFENGRINRIREGSDILLLAMGGIIAETIAAADLLREKGISAEIAAVACVNPAPLEELASRIKAFSLIATIESHYIVGGLGSLVAEIIAEDGLGCRLARFGVKGEIPGETGSVGFLRGRHGLTGKNIAGCLEAEWRRPHSHSNHEGS